MPSLPQKQGKFHRVHTKLSNTFLYTYPSTAQAMLEREEQKEKIIGIFNKRLQNTPFAFLAAYDRDGRPDDRKLPIYNRILKVAVGIRYSPIDYSVPRILNFATSKNVWWAIGIASAILTIVNPPLLLGGGAIGAGIATALASYAIAVNVYNIYQETRRTRKASRDTEQTILLEHIAKLKGVDLATYLEKHKDETPPKHSTTKTITTVGKQALILASSLLSILRLDLIHSIPAGGALLYNLYSYTRADLTHHDEKEEARLRIKQYKRALDIPEETTLKQVREQYKSTLQAKQQGWHSQLPDTNIGWGRSFLRVLGNGFSSSALATSKLRSNPRETKRLEELYREFEESIKITTPILGKQISPSISQEHNLSLEHKPEMTSYGRRKESITSILIGSGINTDTAHSLTDAFLTALPAKERSYFTKNPEHITFFYHRVEQDKTDLNNASPEKITEYAKDMAHHYSSHAQFKPIETHIGHIH